MDWRLGDSITLREGRLLLGFLDSNVHRNLTEIRDRLDAVVFSLGVFSLGLDPGAEEQ